MSDDTIHDIADSCLIDGMSKLARGSHCGGRDTPRSFKVDGQQPSSYLPRWIGRLSVLDIHYSMWFRNIFVPISIPQQVTYLLGSLDLT